MQRTIAQSRAFFGLGILIRDQASGPGIATRIICARNDSRAHHSASGIRLRVRGLPRALYALAMTAGHIIQHPGSGFGSGDGHAHYMRPQ